jgi:ubiquinone/menaquinone biosynthesis C-methylase UbiE
MTQKLTENEQITTVVFGDTFALYSDDEFEEFIGFLRTRFERNGIPLSVFEGKRCLDAGCGGGRATILMAEAGASEVVALDLSETNVETTRMRAEQRGLTNVTAQQASLLEVPFEDQSFDVVWSNGVLHHTGDTDGSLKEIARLLKPGGWMWLYLYGSGGIYWHMVDWVRDRLREGEIHVSECIAQLRLQNVPVRRIAEWIDDWFVPVLQRYKVEDVRLRLEELGFEGAQALERGTHYDTSERRVGAAQEEIELMGDGDVRFWSQKTTQPSGGDDAKLPDAPDGKGSFWEDGPAVLASDPALDRVRTALEQLEQGRGSEAGAYRIMVCGLVHSQVRTLLETPGPFDVAALETRLGEIASLCEAFAALGA